MLKFKFAFKFQIMFKGSTYVITKNGLLKIKGLGRRPKYIPFEDVKPKTIIFHKKLW